MKLSHIWVTLAFLHIYIYLPTIPLCTFFLLPSFSAWRNGRLLASLKEKGIISHPTKKLQGMDPSLSSQAGKSGTLEYVLFFMTLSTYVFSDYLNKKLMYCLCCLLQHLVLRCWCCALMSSLNIREKGTSAFALWLRAAQVYSVKLQPRNITSAVMIIIILIQII